MPTSKPQLIDYCQKRLLKVGQTIHLPAYVNHALASLKPVILFIATSIDVSNNQQLKGHCILLKT